MKKEYFILMLFIICLLAACLPNHRLAEYTFIPSFENKNELHASAFIDYRVNLSGQLAYSVTDKIYIKTQYSFHKYFKVEEIHHNNYFPDINKQENNFNFGVGLRNLWQKNVGFQLSTGWIKNRNALPGKLNNTRLSYDFDENFSRPNFYGDLTLTYQNFKFLAHKSWPHKSFNIHLGLNYNLDLVKNRTGALIYSQSFSGTEMQPGKLFHSFSPLFQFDVGPKVLRLSFSLSYKLNLTKINDDPNERIGASVGLISNFALKNKQPK